MQTKKDDENFLKKLREANSGQGQESLVDYASVLGFEQANPDLVENIIGNFLCKIFRNSFELPVL